MTLDELTRYAVTAHRTRRMHNENPDAYHAAAAAFNTALIEFWAERGHLVCVDAIRLLARSL